MGHEFMTFIGKKITLNSEMLNNNLRDVHLKHSETFKTQTLEVLIESIRNFRL